jgi:hypothetical protein
LVGRFGAHFRHFRLAISVSFTVTALVALYFGGLANDHYSSPTPPPPTALRAESDRAAAEAKQAAERLPAQAKQAEDARAAAQAKQAEAEYSAAQAKQAGAERLATQAKRAEAERATQARQAEDARAAAQAAAERPAAMAKRAEADRAARQRNAEQVLLEMSRAKYEADKAEAERWTPQLLAEAAAKESEGRAAVGRQDWDSALQRFREAQTEYQKAADESKRLAAITPSIATPPPLDDAERKRRRPVMPAF